MKLTYTKIFVFTLLLQLPSFVSGQNKFNINLKKNSVFVEALGIAKRYSINYERIEKIHKNIYLAVAIGGSYSKNIQVLNQFQNNFNYNYFTYKLPARLHVLVHKRYFYFEFGLDYMFEHYWNGNYSPNPSGQTNHFLLWEFGGRLLFNRLYVKLSMLPMITLDRETLLKYTLLLPVKKKNPWYAPFDFKAWPSIGIGFNF